MRKKGKWGVVKITWVNFPAIKQLSAPVYGKERTLLGLQKAI